MAGNADGRLVEVQELVTELVPLRGSNVRIECNGDAPDVVGELLDATSDRTRIDDRELAVAHLSIRRNTRDGSTPVMVSLVTGVDPDGHFFWPVCPIEVETDDGSVRFLLR